jgi:hypothetical protein
MRELVNAPEQHRAAVVGELVELLVMLSAPHL